VAPPSQPLEVEAAKPALDDPALALAFGSLPFGHLASTRFLLVAPLGLKMAEFGRW
jgi:hypothetical protein